MLTGGAARSQEVETEVAYPLAFGFALGFSLAIPPGPNNALMASLAVRSLRSGIITGFGALTADLALGGLVYGLRSEVSLGSVVRWIYVIGAVVMVVLGLRLLQRSKERGYQEAGGTSTYIQALVVAISSPFSIVWWLTSGLAFAYLGGVVLFVGLYSAVLIWILAFPAAVHRGTRHRPGLSRAILYLSSAVMFTFAAYFAFLAL